jgi:3-phosphoinositide dependent protein kinase-1
VFSVMLDFHFTLSPRLSPIIQSPLLFFCMIRVEVPQHSPQPSFQPSLADLSRNASVISSSSSSDSTSSLLLNTPPSRPRPIRTFSSPRTRSPQATSRNPSRPPSYLTGNLGRRDDCSSTADAKRSAAGTRSQSRNRSVNGRLSAQDFVFGEELGEGSYSTVRHCPSYCPSLVLIHT